MRRSRDVIPAAREGRGPKGRGPSLDEAHAAHAVLPARDAVRDRRDLRRRMHEAYATRASDLGSTPPGTTARSSRASSPPPRGRDAARLSQLRAGPLVPKMAEHPGRGDRVPARPRAPRQAPRSGTSPSSPRSRAEPRPHRRSSRGTCVRLREAEGALRVRRAGGAQYLPRTACCWPVPRGERSTGSPSARRAETTRRRASSRSAMRGAIVGEFHSTPTRARTKQGGAWMDDAINRRTVHGRSSIRSRLTCNLRRPWNQQARPSRTTRSSPSSTSSGTACTSSPAVDIPASPDCRVSNGTRSSCRRSSWRTSCWEWDVVRHMTASRRHRRAHHRARSSTARRRAPRTSSAGWQTVRQIEMGLFDMLVHAGVRRGRGGTARTPQAILAEVRARGGRGSARAVRPVPGILFSHVFRRAARRGLHSYQWAEVLSADAFSLFEEEGVLSPAVGTLPRRGARAWRQPAPRSNRSSPSAAARPNWTPSCGIMEWSKKRVTRRHVEPITTRIRIRRVARSPSRRRVAFAQAPQVPATSIRADAAASCTPTGRRRPTSKNVQTKRLGPTSSNRASQHRRAAGGRERFPATLHVRMREVCQNAEALLNRRGVPFTRGRRAEDEQGAHEGADRDRAPVLAVGDKMDRRAQRVCWQAVPRRGGYPENGGSAVIASAEVRRRAPAAGRRMFGDRRRQGRRLSAKGSVR